LNRTLYSAALLAVLVVLVVGARAAAQAPDLARLFPRELDVTVESGPARLAIPADLLGTARPDLADVRLFEANGDELPFFIDSGARPAPATIPAPTPAPPIGATRRASGAYVTESFDLPMPPSSYARYELSMAMGAPDFVRDLRIFAVNDRGETSAVPLVDTTIFRFQTPLRQRVRFALPPVPAGTRALRVTIEGQGGGLGWGRFYGALEPVFTYEPVFTPLDPPTLAIALRVRATRRLEGRTELDVELPLGVRPDRLRIATSTPNFVRRVSASDDTQLLGSGDVFRVEALRARGGEWLEVPLDRARGDELTITIDDGDSPALAGLQLSAIVRQPALVFFADGAPITLRYGGGRARAPRYDIEALGRVGLSGTLIEGDAMSDARASAPRRNALFDAAPALAFLARPGVVVDAQRYSHVAEITVPDAREGIVRVRVPAAAMSVARADLGDLRVVSADGKQWPYVLAERSKVELPLVVSAPVREGDETRYTLRMTVTSAFVTALRLDVDARFTERPFRVEALDDQGQEFQILSGYLSRGPDERGPIEREALQTRARNLVLIVEDGDDAPLVIRSAVVVAQVGELRLAAPAGTYRLLAGDPSAEAPRYELSRARALIAAVPLGEAQTARATKNPAFHEPSFLERSGWQAIALWAALALAVLVLGGLTLRLARMESDGDASPAADSPASPVTAAEPQAESATVDPPPTASG